MPESNIEKFRYGQFSLTPEEKKKAIKEGTLEEERKKMKTATARLRTEQDEKAL